MLICRKMGEGGPGWEVPRMEQALTGCCCWATLCVKMTKKKIKVAKVY